MRMRVLAVTVLLLCGGVAARAEDAPPAPPAADTPTATQPAPQSSTPKQSLERAPADSKPDQTVDRTSHFSLQRVDGGFLRFDADTGHMAYCSFRGGGWSCEVVPENRAALEKEIERLRGEVADLKQQLKAQEEPPRPPQLIPVPPQTVPPATTQPNNGSTGDMTDLPGSQQISRAAAALQDAWRRFVELVNGLKNDVLRKSI